jgi:hypothetical protein
MNFVSRFEFTAGKIKKYFGRRVAVFGLQHQKENTPQYNTIMEPLPFAESVNK